MAFFEPYQNRRRSEHNAKLLIFTLIKFQPYCITVKQHYMAEPRVSVITINNIKYLNCTPHPINVGGVVLLPCGACPRVSSSYEEVSLGLYRQTFGEVEGLPEQADQTRFVVSAMVLAASSRKDLVAPATSHPLTQRDDQGHIVSVPGFVCK